MKYLLIILFFFLSGSSAPITPKRVSIDSIDLKLDLARIEANRLRVEMDRKDRIINEVLRDRLK